MGSSSDLSGVVSGGDAGRVYGVDAAGASLPAPERLFTAQGLTGTWHVTRVIEDALTGGTARLTGEARFTPDADGLIYDERGTLVLDSGQSFAANRRYLWRFGYVVRVLFDDGRLFHVLDPRQPEAELVHHCGDDIYRGAYRVGADHWTTWWQVTGPRKDQLSRIRYHRARLET